ncbi:MAG: nicotinamide-nucleotide amidohydrolase family protein [Clostridia bacterium]|nr:nicotinamide-nucleotide amidohydrolase family protein [Clostridia bacterium]
MKIEHMLISALAERALTLATAESCTGGLIAKRITDVPGASAVYLGSVVSYANEVKIGLLGVSADTLAAHGAVSAEVAAQMARGVRRATGADIAVSTTGIAGPGGGTPTKPVGTVWVGVSTADGEVTQLLQLDPDADRAAIRDEAVSRALALVMEAIG